MEPKAGKKTRFDQICQFFSENENDWATVDEIAASGIPKATVVQILYIAKPSEFERLHEGRGDPQMFRLKRFASRVDARETP